MFSHKETVDIKYLDETNTAEEVAQIITSVIGAGIVTTANIRLRASYSETQGASVLLTVTATKKPMKARKLRISKVRLHWEAESTATRPWE